MLFRKISILFLVLSAGGLGFFTYQVIQVLTTVLNSLHQILTLKSLLFWVEKGIVAFYVSAICFLLASLFVKSKGGLFGVGGYLGLMILFHPIFGHVINANRVFECSLHFQEACVSYTRMLETVNFDILQFDVLLVGIFLLLMVIGYVMVIRKVVGDLSHV